MWFISNEARGEKMRVNILATKYFFLAKEGRLIIGSRSAELNSSFYLSDWSMDTLTRK